MATTLISNASEKVRKTKVRVDWFYDRERKAWRFLPTDMTHRASYKRTDRDGSPMQDARTHEAKNWTPADVAITDNPQAKMSAPDAVKERYAHLFGQKQEEA